MPEQRPRISVVICTRNRSTMLGAAIDSVLGQRLARVHYEVLVVDNGSTDPTAAVVRARGERVKYLFEPALGLSNARNTGWQQARGGFVALLDDDGIADDHWLGTLLERFESSASPACVGGRVTPVWGAPRPSWLSDRLLLALTVADWGPSARGITDLSREWLVGANIAFRRDALARLGGFPTSLGRKGNRLLSGEEIFLQRRLLAEGRECWYEPAAHVQHHVAVDRLSPRWFYRRHYAQGISDAVMWELERDRHGEGRLARVTDEGRQLASASLGWIRRELQGAWSGNRVEESCGVLWRLGFTTGLARLA